jgi:hypothetical protein
MYIPFNNKLNGILIFLLNLFYKNHLSRLAKKILSNVNLNLVDAILIITGFAPVFVNLCNNISEKCYYSKKMWNVNTQDDIIVQGYVALV